MVVNDNNKGLINYHSADDIYKCHLRKQQQNEIMSLFASWCSIAMNKWQNWKFSKNCEKHVHVAFLCSHAGFEFELTGNSVALKIST